MKKNYFFIAALAIGMMSSCTNEIIEEVELPSLPDQVIDEGSTRMAIELGISMPEASVSTRGTGSVGSIVEADNQWNSQELGILMFKKGTSDEALEILNDAGEPYAEGEAPTVLDGVKFVAPAAGENSNGGLIRMINEDGNIQAKYYPMTGAYDFYGYHIDDIALEDDALVATGAVASDDLSIQLQGLVIDGTQDILAAKTKAVDDTNYPNANWTVLNGVTNVENRYFSSWAARNDVQPILDFQHMLTRLTFTIEAGSPEAAENYYATWNVSEETQDPETGETSTTERTESGWLSNSIWINSNGVVDNQVTEPTSTAVEIYEIEVLDVVNTMDLDITNLEVIADSEAALDTFQLKSVNVDATEIPAQLIDLVAEAPANYAADASNYDESYPQTTPIGESMMIYPGVTEIKMNIYLSQWVVDTENPETGEPLTYKQKKTVLPAVAKLVDNAAYEAGTSYNINLKVYGFQRIEVYAALTAWENGGNIEVDPEDQGWGE